MAVFLFKSGQYCEMFFFNCAFFVMWLEPCLGAETSSGGDQPRVVVRNPDHRGPTMPGLSTTIRGPCLPRYLPTLQGEHVSVDQGGQVLLYLLPATYLLIKIIERKQITNVLATLIPKSFFNPQFEWKRSKSPWQGEKTRLIVGLKLTFVWFYGYLFCRLNSCTGSSPFGWYPWITCGNSITIDSTRLK